MSSMFSSHTLITGGTFTNHNDTPYHGFRESSDILHRATATAAFHNSDERSDPPKCHPNTRLAVLTKIMKWIKGEEDLDAFIMWMYGPAGAGKSAIAQTIAEMCEEEMILLASFFFSRNDPSRSIVKPLIATIAYQITLNLPDIRDAILGAIDRDPLIFSKSLAVQVKSLIVAPLQQLAEAGFFNKPTSRRLVIIDGLDECSDPKVQQNIVDVLANAQRQHGLPLIFLISSRPEQQISLAFSTGVLPNMATRVALDESYLPDEDIRVFLTDRFQELKSTHRLRAYIHPQWPFPAVLGQLIKKSSGQFIYASTVICYVSSIRHKPMDRLDIVLGIRPPQKDLPFAELDALYMHILAGVEDVEPVLKILGFLFFRSPLFSFQMPFHHMEEFLSLQPGDVELYLGDLSSLINIGPNQGIRVLHASLQDFLVDPTRSKEFWINPRARHTAFARRCLQSLQVKENVHILIFIFNNTTYYIENAEITPELHDDLINFSFDKLQDVFKNYHTFFNRHGFTLLTFIPYLLADLKKLPLSESDHICQAFQVHFDRMLCNVLEKYHCFPGFALLLGSLLWYTTTDQPIFLIAPGIAASLFFVRQQQGHILGDVGFSGVWRTTSHNYTSQMGTEEFCAYLAELLENPGRSRTYVFDQKRYATAAKECLELCLCSRRNFSKGATESAFRDNGLRRSKPWAWITRLGVHGRIRKARQHLVRQQKLRTVIDQFASLSENSPEHEYYRCLAYGWALDLLPFLLEKSDFSLELADVLRSRTFTTMAEEFPRRRRLAKEAIRKYLVRVESAVGDS